jgi:hypothetical protein
MVGNVVCRDDAAGAARVRASPSATLAAPFAPTETEKRVDS